MDENPAVPHRRWHSSRPLTLRWTMLISFGSLFAVTLLVINLVRTFGIPFTTYAGSYGDELSEALRNVDLVADLKKERFLLWLGERRNDIRTLALNQNIASSLPELRKELQRNLESGNRGDPVERGVLWQAIYQRVFERLRLIKNTHSVYEKIHIADAATGLILASTVDTEVGTDVSTRPYFVDAIHMPRDISVTLELDQLNNKSYLVFSQSAPDPDHGYLSVVATFVDTDAFVRPMLYTAGNLGEAGEVELVNHNAQILTPLKHPLRDGTEAKVLVTRLNTQAAFLAAQGKEGSLITQDYRGVPVLAAHRTLAIMPGERWGMVVKVSRAEVLAGLWQRMLFSTLLSVAGLVGAGIMAILISSRISRPIEALGRIAQQVESGDFRARAEVKGTRESQVVAGAFNSMIERVQGWHEELEKEVRSRTVHLTAEIARRKRVEADLAQEKERLSVTLRSIGDGVISTDTDGKVVNLNGVAEELTGWSYSEALGRPLRDVFRIVNEITRQPCDNPVHKVLSTGRVVGLANHTALISRDGSERAIADAGAPIRDEYGNTIGVVLVFRDVTERRRAQERFLREKEFSDLAIESLPGPFYVVDEHMRFVRWNTMLERVTGRSADEIAQLNAFDLFREEDKTIIAEGVHEVFSAGQAWREASMVRKDGTEIPLLLTGRRIMLESARSVVGMAIDITDWKRAENQLRQSEERYRTLFEQSRDAVYMTGPDGRLTEVNQAFLSLFGFTREEAANMDISAIYDDPAGRLRFQEEIDKKGAVDNYEIQFVRKDRVKMDCLLTATPRLDADGTILGYQGIVRDVTERRRLENQLVQSQKMEAVGTLAGGVAHDFNNILQVVLGYSELLIGDEGLTHRYRADLQKIYEAANRGADLVQRLLTFSRKTETNPQPLNLNRRIRELRKMLERTIPKMIDIQIFPADDLASINADPTQVDQVLMNLAVNARDAMTDGGTLIIETANVNLNEEYARAHADVNPGSYVLLAVTDTGSGMDKETLERIFEPFYTTKETGKGTGLGLAVVLGIVQQHRGHIKCYSEPGKGTTFKIYFPALVSDENSEEMTSRAMPQGGSETILLVDDEEMIRGLCSRILTIAGYTVIAASNGKEALKLYQERSAEIALVILDLIMPEMSGKECLEGLLRLDASVKVVIASGYSANGPTADALAAGAKGFVNKPYDIRQVLAVVRETLDAQ